MPKYITIADDLLAQINTGLYRPSQKLPSEKELMKKYDVSRQTIRNAMEFLGEQGHVYSEQGKGTFVTSASPAVAPASFSNNIAIILNALNDYIFPYKIASINSVLTPNGYISNVFNANYSISEQEQIITNIMSAPYAGVIIEISRGNIPRIRPDLYRELSRKMPVIFMDGDCYGLKNDIPTVSMDDFQCGYLAADYLIQHGHRHIFHIGKIDDTQGIKRWQGYVRALRDHHIVASDRDVFWLTGSSRGIDEDIKFDTVISRIKDYSAVYFFNDLSAKVFIPQLLKAGIHIPEDLSIVSNDDFFPDIEGIALTGVRYPRTSVGAKAAEQLLKLINDPTFDANYSITPKLIERDSVRTI